MLANEYTEDCLQKLSKPQLIAMVLSQRDKTTATIESLRDEAQEMNINFADVSLVKTVNNLLMKKSVDIQRQCCANAQYPRRECLEIAGILTSIPQQRLIRVFRSFVKNCGTGSKYIPFLLLMVL